MASERRVAFSIASWLLALTVTLAVGEGALRVVFAYRLNYNIEMVKYAKALKQRDSGGEVSHVHRPNTSATLMGVEVALNSLGDRGPEVAAKQPASTRVLVLGSSVTLVGACRSIVCSAPSCSRV